MTTKIASTNWFDIAADSVEVKTAPEPRIVELDEATTGTTEPLRIPDITSEPAALDTTGDGTDTKTRRTPHWRRAVSLVVSTAVVTGWFMMLRPTSLGGPASILVVRGVSMQPTMDYGDVIIAHALCLRGRRHHRLPRARERDWRRDGGDPSHHRGRRRIRIPDQGR